LARVSIVVTQFRSLRPAHASTQEETLRWLAAAHAEAEERRAGLAGEPFDRARFDASIAHRLHRFGCGEDKIGVREFALEDCAHTRWTEMRVYDMGESPHGQGMLGRTRVYAGLAEQALRDLYPDADDPPQDLLHVTCTGYVSPSAAQKLVAERGWGGATRVTHAYHMGCYAALPALRVAEGLLHTEPNRPGSGARRCDVAHTEICSIHMNPLLHTAEQLVIQTLFADGFIRYSVRDRSSWDRRTPALEVIAAHERILPDSADAMAWICADTGMHMTLARDVPERIVTELRDFVEELSDRAGLGAEQRRGAVYAVHPGGPRIVDQVRDALGLADEDLSVSRGVLRRRGNMSSATLPHIWMELAESEAVMPGRPILSLAFGPGLTICGAVLRKPMA
jgi:predicted naringenin-chalcone synthase